MLLSQKYRKYFTSTNQQYNIVQREKDENRKFVVFQYYYFAGLPPVCCRIMNARNTRNLTNICRIPVFAH
jgi:hypothetical protein